MQDPETQHNIEPLAELAHVQRVHPSVLDPRADQPRDRTKANATQKRHTEASTHPVNVLLIVDRDHAPRAAELRKKAVEAIERANIEHATARKTIRAEHRKAVAVVARDPRRVDPRRKRERVKPQRNRIADTLSIHGQRADRVHVRDDPLRTRRLRNRLDRLDRVCKARQRINSSLSFT